MKKGLIVRSSNTIKPHLTEDNKEAHLKFAMDHVSSLTTLRGGSRMNDMFNVVHIDEKWFHLTKVKQTIYLLPHEVGPERSTQSKKIIPKIMFLCAVARSRFNKSKSQYFDGKIALWPFFHQVPAARNSKNRSKETLITKPKIADRNEFRCIHVEKVILAIKAKWPGNKEDIIWIQQDNAKPHTTPSDVVVAAAGIEGRWSIQLKNQPPNSPDLNILDLGFFNTIQSFQYEKVPRVIDELIATVVDSLHDVTSEKLDNNFLTFAKSYGMYHGMQWRKQLQTSTYAKSEEKERRKTGNIYQN